jgi:hypothetical protein
MLVTVLESQAPTTMSSLTRKDRQASSLQLRLGHSQCAQSRGAPPPARCGSCRACDGRKDKMVSDDEVQDIE